MPAATPAYPEYLYPVVPDGMRGGPASLALDRGWQRLQRDERTEAGREFTAALQRQADFYPARTAQGYLALAERRLDEALAAFDATLARTPVYVPALVGRGHTLLALDRVAAAADAFDAALTLEPTMDDLRRRVEVLQVRRVQAGIERARAAMAAGDTTTARDAYRTALEASPESAFLHRELAAVERAAGDDTRARVHLQQAAALDPEDAPTHQQLGMVLEALQDVAAALRAYSRAAALAPDPALDARIDVLTRSLRDAELPNEFRGIADRATMTRGDLAALIAVRFDDMFAATPRQEVVITDARDHWAVIWIRQVVAAGLMDTLENHAFQPAVPLRRMDLADVAARLIRLTGVAGLETARTTTIADMQATHLSFPAVSTVVAAGVMPLVDGREFQGTRDVTGREAIAVIDRVRALAAAR